MFTPYLEGKHWADREEAADHNQFLGSTPPVAGLGRRPGLGSLGAGSGTPPEAELDSPPGVVEDRHPEQQNHLSLEAVEDRGLYTDMN